jgi:hypothetical protein
VKPENRQFPPMTPTFDQNMSRISSGRAPIDLAIASGMPSCARPMSTCQLQFVEHYKAINLRTYVVWAKEQLGNGKALIGHLHDLILFSRLFVCAADAAHLVGRKVGQHVLLDD